MTVAVTKIPRIMFWPLPGLELADRVHTTEHVIGLAPCSVRVAGTRASGGAGNRGHHVRAAAFLLPPCKRMEDGVQRVHGNPKNAP
jgi:hypothetical protein